MTRVQIRKICVDRLAGWTEKLVMEDSTPALLLGIGHGAKSGQVTILTTEETTDAQIAVFLRFALSQITE